jgi:hypothetical protein
LNSNHGVHTVRHTSPPRRLGVSLSLLLIVASSVSGALVFRLALFGPDTSLVAADRRLLFTFMAGAILAIWAALFAWSIKKIAPTSWERALYWATLCQIPMLTGLAVVWACVGSGVAWRGFSDSQTGRLLLQPMAADWLIGATAAAQLLLLALLKRRFLLRHLPIIGILVIGLALRASHLGWGLPGLLHPDEHRYLGPAIIMAARGDLNPHYFQNPSLMIYLSYLTLLLMAPQSRAFLTAGSVFSLGVPNPRGDFLDMLAIRGVEVVAGTLTILAVYLATRELFDRRAALMSSLLLAISFLHVRNSHYATNDILATCLLAFSFYFVARIYTRGRASDYLLAGLIGGLATTAKYNVGLFAAAIVVAHLAQFFRTGPSVYPWRRHLLLPAAGALSVLAFLAGTPYALLDYPSFLADFRSQYGYGSDVWNGQQSQPTAQLFLSTLEWGLGLIPLILAAIGSLLMARRSGWRAALLLAIPVSYFVVMSAQKLFFARFALPALPFLCILAGYAIWRLGQTRWHLLTALLLFAAIAQPLAMTLQHDRLLGRPDTRFLAAQWIDANIPHDATLAVESYSTLDPKFGWRGHGVKDSWLFWPENDESVAKAIGGAYRYVVVSDFGYGPWQLDGAPSTTLPGPYAPLAARGRLVVQFTPGRANSDLPYAIDEMYTPFWHLFDRERPGPTVRIYEVN